MPSSFGSISLCKGSAISHCKGSGPRALADQPSRAQPTCGICALAPLAFARTSYLGFSCRGSLAIASATYLRPLVGLISNCKRSSPPAIASAAYLGLGCLGSASYREFSLLWPSFLGSISHGKDGGLRSLTHRPAQGQSTRGIRALALSATSISHRKRTLILCCR